MLRHRSRGEGAGRGSRRRCCVDTTTVVQRGAVRRPDAVALRTPASESRVGNP